MSKTTTTAATKYAPPAEYIELVSRFPIRPLTSEAEYKAAMQVMESLVGRQDLSKGGDDYVAGLSVFVEQYENQHHPLELPRVSPRELLRALMENRGMSVTDLGNVIGNRSLASMIYNGSRGISKANMARLAAFFGVEPSVFMDPQGVQHFTITMPGSAKVIQAMQPFLGRKKPFKVAPRHLS